LACSWGDPIRIFVYQAISIAGGIGFIHLFISLFAQRNEPKKGPPVSLVPPKAGCPEFMPRMGYSSMLPGVCKLGYASNSANSFFGSLSGARLRANGILTAVKAKELTEREGITARHAVWP
jgi:hypothetical protein